MAEERAATKVTEKIGDARGMSKDEADAQTAVYKMISASIAAAEDIRMVAKIFDMLDVIRNDYVELRLTLRALPDVLAGKVDPKLSAKVRAVADEQVQEMLEAPSEDVEIDDDDEECSICLNLGILQKEATTLLEETDFSEGLAEFKRLFARHKAKYLRSKPRMPFVEWTKKAIKLTPQETSRAGGMKLSVYQREIGNNNFHKPECRQVTVLKGVQIGYSKGLGAIYGYSVVEMAKNTSVVFPVKEDMQRFLKDELAKLQTRSKPIKRLLRPAKRKEVADAMSEYRYANGAIAYYRAAHNEDDLQGFTSWLQIADEADRSG